MKKIFRKLRSSRGFTLAETLICILILLMVTGIVAGAIPAAGNSYAKAVDAANAQILMSTAMTVLRDELSNAKQIDPPVTDGAGASKTVTISYVSGDTGRKSKIVSTAKEIRIYEYGFINTDGDQDYKTERLVVSEKAATRNLSVSFDSASYADHVVTIGGLKVLRESSTNPLASRTSYSIRTLG